MIVRRAVKNSTVVAGGGAIDVCDIITKLTLPWSLYNGIFCADVVMFFRWK